MEGKDPEKEMERARQEEQFRSMSLKEFFPEYMKKHGSRLSDSMQRRILVFRDNLSRCPEIAESPIGSINKRMMAEYAQLRLEQDEVSPATVNREISFLRSVLNKAVEWDVLQVNPLHGIKMLKESGKREVNVSPTRIAALRSKLPPVMSQIVGFAASTGFRKENVLSLRVEDIAIDNERHTGTARLKVKGGRRITFPLGEKAIRIFQEAVGERREGYVFLNPQTNDRYYSLGNTFDRAVRKIGLEVDGTKFRFHDLRHFFASSLYQKRSAARYHIRLLMGSSNTE